MIDKIINYIRSCFKENEEGKRKRKIVMVIGLIIVSFRVFFGFIYKVSKWFHYIFNGKMVWLRNILYFLGFIAILFISSKIYINYVNNN